MKMEGQIRLVNIENIIPNRFQPRLQFDEEALNELAASIKEHGIIQPLVLRSVGDKFEIIAGERRYKASKKAGLKTIPAIIITSLPDDLREKQLIENIQRSELSFTEIADTIQYLIDVKKMKKKDIASSLSKSNSYVTLYYNYAKIDSDIKELLTPKTKDITLIVEINKFLNNAEPDIYAATFDYIKSIDNINRNIIDKLNDLSTSDKEVVITDEDLARPNIEDYLDETKDTTINETVQKLEIDEKDNNELIIENNKNNGRERQRQKITYVQHFRSSAPEVLILYIV